MLWKDSGTVEPSMEWKVMSGHLLDSEHVRDQGNRAWGPASWHTYVAAAAAAAVAGAFVRAARAGTHFDD